jgi:hypothetical protein
VPAAPPRVGVQRHDDCFSTLLRRGHGQRRGARRGKGKGKGKGGGNGDGKRTYVPGPGEESAPQFVARVQARKQKPASMRQSEWSPSPQRPFNKNHKNYAAELLAYEAKLARKVRLMRLPGLAAHENFVPCVRFNFPPLAPR